MFTHFYLEVDRITDKVSLVAAGVKSQINFKKIILN